MPEFQNERITSRKNPLIVRLSKLSEKKYREEEGLFRIDGFKLYAEAIKSGIEIVYTFVSDSAAQKAEGLTAGCTGTVIPVSDEVLAKLTDERAPQGIVAFARFFDTADTADDADERTLLLSSVRDPGNLGTVIRTAYAFGLDRVWLTSDCADIYSPKVLRAAMGTIFRQKLGVVSDELALIARLRAQGTAVYAAALDDRAVRLDRITMEGRLCFAVGNEGHGLSPELIAACTGTAIIPMNPGCESLNAAAAAGILAWEMGRGRL